MSVQTSAKPQVADIPPVYVTAEGAKAFGVRLLLKHGLSEADAATVAGCLVRADLRGVDTHGLQYLPHYLDRVRRGLINPRPALNLTQATPAAASLDGDNGFGFVVASKGMKTATEMADKIGIGIVACKRSTHFGMAACYLLHAVEAGYMAMVFTNASPSMPPWGGRVGLFGTSPLAAGAPAGKGPAFVLDMSPAAAARGKIRRAARRGQSIPLGYALDRQGRQTTDPNVALDGGTVQPIGTYKGSGIAMMMDVFCGVFSGAASGGDVGNQFEDYDRPQNVGHFLLAMKPDLFVPLETFHQQMDNLVRSVHDNPLAEGFTEIVVAGEVESRLEAKRQRSGIPYNVKDVASLQKEAASHGLPPLPTSDQPLSL
jgi:LDH2 family malate/lactate/ureidoglycolate dehydrogenase